ncbi:MAG: hypothetical protein HZY76_07650 [Anaerolineae bacterium]|nr:MAG: hypothetical protein HZY76_07650 [Anaerolineae bacterium]
MREWASTNGGTNERITPRRAGAQPPDKSVQPVPRIPQQPSIPHPPSPIPQPPSPIPHPPTPSPTPKAPYANPGDLLNQLATALAQPYSDHISARTRATTAGLRAVHPLRPQPFDYWVAILQAAEEQGVMPRLLAQAAAEYPVEPDLHTARAAYNQWVAAGRPQPPLAVPPPRLRLPRHRRHGRCPTPRGDHRSPGRARRSGLDRCRQRPAGWPWSSKLLRGSAPAMGPWYC